MDQVTEATFRTKAGTCTVTPERIVLARTGARGAAASVVTGDSVGRLLLIYGLFGVVALAGGFWSLSGGNVAAGLPLGAVGIFFLWIVVISRRNSATPIIDRAAIRTVEAYPPRPPATRGRFEVWFEEGGRLRRRLILLPGSLDGGGAEYARAEAILRDAGLLSGASPVV